MPVTIKEIASKAKVSHGLVSAILNGSNDKLRSSDETRARVLSIASELGYRPNSLARGLRGKRTKSVGLIWPFADEWIGDGVIGQDILRDSHDRGYATFYAESRYDSEYLGEIIDDFSQRCVDALIMHGPTAILKSKKIVEQLNALPAAVVVTQSPIESLSCDQLIHNRIRAIEEVADYFAVTGRKRPAMVVSMDDPDNHAKYHAFRDRLMSLGVEDHEDMLMDMGRTVIPHTEHLQQKIRSRSEQLSRIDAILCLNDFVAIAVTQGLKSCGRGVPDEVGVVGMNNSDVASLWSPPLASIDRRRQQIKAAVMSMAIKRLQRPKMPPQRQQVDMSFVWRDSAGARVGGLG